MFSRSKIFIISALSFIVGIFLGSYLPYNLQIYIALVVIFASLILLFWSEPKVRIICLIILFLILGSWRYVLSEPLINSRSVQFYNGQKLALVGVIVDEPDVRKDKTNLVLDIDQIKLNNSSLWQKVSGKILLQVRNYPQYKYGNELKIKGTLETPPEFDDFSYRDYLARYQIYSTMRNAKTNLLAQNKGNPVRSLLLNIKTSFAQKIDQTLPEPQASLLAGILYGAKRGIPTDIMDSFNKTGLTHIVVISGYNITIIASMLLALFGFLPRRWAFILTLTGISLFTISVGAGASVVRAAIMGSIGLLAFHVERKSNIFSALLLAATIMLLWNPKILRFDIGFQLSFLSTIGLIFLAPYFERFFKKIPKFLNEPASLTLSAQLFSIPIILLNFHRLSLIAPVANVLVLTVVPTVMIFGFVGTALSFLILPLGQLVNWASWALLTYIIKITQFLSRLPFASLEFKINNFWVIAYYLLMIGFISWPFLQKKISKSKPEVSEVPDQ